MKYNCVTINIKFTLFRIHMTYFQTFCSISNVFFFFKKKRIQRQEVNFATFFSYTLSMTKTIVFQFFFYFKDKFQMNRMKIKLKYRIITTVYYGGNK